MKMDVQWGYNNIYIAEGNEWKAAFTTKYSLFEPTIMFFGLTNSPAIFQHMIDNIFVKELDEGWLLAYMNDNLIAIEDEPSKHIACARQACKIFKENNLYVKPEKCKFMVKKIEFLGFFIEDGKISMNPTKIKGITDWPAPVMVKQV